jgi:ribosomal protein S18 acetylase RimI-like enzyme
MQLRLMTPEDHRDVLELWSGTPGIGLNSIDDAPEGIRKYLERNPSSCFVALEDGVLAGAILCGHDGRRGYIYHAAVRPEFRRLGVGRALVDAATDALKKEGIIKAALVTFRGNASGNMFWESLGFTERDDLVYRNMSLLD